MDCYQDKWRFPLKIANFSTPHVFCAPAEDLTTSNLVALSQTLWPQIEVPRKLGVMWPTPPSDEVVADPLITSLRHGLAGRCLSNGTSRCGYPREKFVLIDHFSPFKVTQGH